MLAENFRVLLLPELLNLLGEKTTQMVDMMRQKGADIVKIRDLKKDIQSIQSAISGKRSSNSVFSHFVSIYQKNEST
jgi:uroporphyrinogen-III decarboxylase